MNLPSKTRKLIKRGLTKVCESTESWIVTSGANSGVSKMVGDGLAESHRFAEFVTIGVISLQRVACGDELITMAQHHHHQQDDASSARHQSHQKTKTYYGVKEDPLKQNTTFLDHNHSHFVLVNNDDGETNTDDYDEILQQEVLFRMRLERELRTGWSVPSVAPHLEGNESDRHSLSSATSNEIKPDFSSAVPSILICINGQYESLLLIKESLREKVSVLIVAVSIYSLIYFILLKS